MGARSYQDIFAQRTDESGRVYYRYTGEALDENAASETDVHAVNEGAISITPLTYRFTNEAMIATLKMTLGTHSDGRVNS
ncbi:hypothetical protein GCM10025857_00870 [Alicyclobacillus contaminans]|nr:hypothetical protein GCM10025857_00870 [Alicyclobacillus contaminans]